MDQVGNNNPIKWGPAKTLNNNTDFTVEDDLLESLLDYGLEKNDLSYIKRVIEIATGKHKKAFPSAAIKDLADILEIICGDRRNDINSLQTLTTTNTMLAAAQGLIDALAEVDKETNTEVYRFEMPANFEDNVKNFLSAKHLDDSKFVGQETKARKLAQEQSKFINLVLSKLATEEEFKLKDPQKAPKLFKDLKTDLKDIINSELRSYKHVKKLNHKMPSLARRITAQRIISTIENLTKPAIDKDVEPSYKSISGRMRADLERRQAEELEAEKQALNEAWAKQELEEQERIKSIDKLLKNLQSRQGLQIYTVFNKVSFGPIRKLMIGHMPLNKVEQYLAETTLHLLHLTIGEMPLNKFRFDYSKQVDNLAVKKELERILKISETSPRPTNITKIIENEKTNKLDDMPDFLLNQMRNNLKTTNIKCHEAQTNIISKLKASLKRDIETADFDRDCFNKAKTKSIPINELLGDTYKGENLSHQDLSGRDFRGVEGGKDFTVANLTSTNFSHANMHKAKLNSSLLNGTNFTGADLREANLVGANVENTLHGEAQNYSYFVSHRMEAVINSLDTKLKKQIGITDTQGHSNNRFAQNILLPSLFHLTNLANANLSLAELSGKDLSKIKRLTGAQLNYAKLICSNIEGLDFSGAHLMATDLRGALAKGANFEHSKLTNADLRGADFSEVAMSHASLVNAKLHRTSFIRSDLKNCILKLANCREACFSQAELSGANFQFANLNKALFFGADLRNANLIGANLRGADLRNADLSGAQLDYADLRGARINNQTMFHHTSIDMIHFEKLFKDYDNSIIYTQRKTIPVFLGYKESDSLDNRKNFQVTKVTTKLKR